jgi:hypothetical protein
MDFITKSKFYYQKRFVLTEQQMDNGEGRSMNNLNILIIQDYNKSCIFFKGLPYKSPGSYTK